jgi:5-hydroxyisourate hydrolase
MSQLTTHILDTSIGMPAAGITILLYQEQNDRWTEIARGITNPEGRIPDLLKKDILLEYGIFKIRVETKEYFDKNSIFSFYPFVEISFNVTSKEHYHIPLLLSPFGYSTYRGS